MAYAAPGKSGLHERGEGERVIVLESWEGTRASRRRETWVPSLGREDQLEKEMAIHFSTIAWKIPWTEEPGRLQSMGSQRVGHD